MAQEQLAAARLAKERVELAETALQAAKADYQRALYRLYIEGASLREIGDALELSHQRVHQLIGARPRSWWSRRRPAAEPDRACTFCGRGPKQARRLIGGPGVLICDRCVDRATEAMAFAGRSKAATAFATLPPDSRRRCCFCGGRGRDRPRVSAQGAHICAPCIAQCREVLEREER